MEDWKRAWQSVVDAVGMDFDSRSSAPADAVEVGAIRRYVEPIELDCALHYDRAVACAYGYADVIAPYTASSTFTIPPMWQPGQETLFPTADRDAQPIKSAVRPAFPTFFPPFTGYFATDIDVDFVRPIHAGERVVRRGNTLLSCEPKETRVGRGAFLKFETEIVTDGAELISKMRTGMFLYTPHGEGA